MSDNPPVSVQLSNLETFKVANDPANYYAALDSYGERYGALARAFALDGNSGNGLADFGALYALNYFKIKYLEWKGTLPSSADINVLKLTLMSADYDARYNNAYPNGFENPPVSISLEEGDIATYHYAVYGAPPFQFPGTFWTGDFFHTFVNDKIWNLTGPQYDPENVMGTLTQGIIDLVSKFSYNDARSFFNDATFGKVFLDTVFQFAHDNPEKAVAALITTQVVSLMAIGDPATLTIEAAGIFALGATYCAPASWNQGLAVGALMAIDTSLTVDSAMTLIDAASNSTFSPGAETIACFNVIRQQFPNVCVPELTSDNFAVDSLALIRTIWSTSFHGTILSPLLPPYTSTNLASSAQSDIGARYMLESGLPFFVESPDTVAAISASKYSDYPQSYWTDRETWLRATLAQNVSDPLFPTGSTTYEDLSTHAQVSTGSSTAAHISFGAHDYGGTSEVDRIYGTALDDVLSGGIGADTLAGGAGHDWLGYTAAALGNETSDEINSDGNTYDGGTDNDHIAGSVHKDVYIFRKGDGMDYVNTHGGGDELRLVQYKDLGGGGQSLEIPESTVSFVRDGADLLVRLLYLDGVSATDQIRIVSWFDNGAGANVLGSVTLGAKTWTSQEITEAALILTGNANGETLTGVSGYHNTFIGKGGDDVLLGGNLGDTFNFARGDGSDEITLGGGSDVIKVAPDLSDTSVRVAASGAGLSVLFSSGDSVLLKDWQSPENNFTLIFADGRQYDKEDVLAALKDTVLVGGLNTFSVTSTMTAQDRAQVANMLAANSSIGSEMELFFQQNPSYASNYTAPQSYTWLLGNNSGNNDLAEWLVNVRASVNGGGVTNTARGLIKSEIVDGIKYSLYTYDNGMRPLWPVITEHSMYSNQFRDAANWWEGAVLAWGPAGGSQTAVKLLGSRAGTYSDGRGDSFAWNYFNIPMNSSEKVTEVTGLNPTDLKTFYSQVGSPSITLLADTQLSGLKEVADLYAGQEPWPTPLDSEVSITILESTGDVYVSDGPGIAMMSVPTPLVPSDIHLSGSQDDVSFSREGGALVATLPEGGVLYYDNFFNATRSAVQTFHFAGGVTLTAEQVAQQVLTIKGTEGADLLTGTSSVNAAPVYALGGNDVFRGGLANDVAFLGDGNDTAYGEGGNDTLDGGTGNDTLDGGTGADVLSGGEGDDVLGGAPGDPSGDSGKDAYGSFISGSLGNTYEGGTGAETLRGTTMADLYLFNLGDGADTIQETYASSGQPTGQVDVLRFGTDIQPSDIVVVRNGNDLFLKLSNGSDQVLIQGWYAPAGSRIERVEFVDGTVWSEAELTSLGLVVSGTSGADTSIGLSGYSNTLNGLEGNDTLTGGALGDILDGGAGNDTLNGLAGADVLEGGEGNDVLDGGQGYDTLHGGAGDDTLGGAKGAASYDSGVSGSSYVSGSVGNSYEGGTGNDLLRGTIAEDLYLFNLGDGADTVVEPDSGTVPAAGLVDVLRFGAGIAPTDITVSRSAADLVLAHVNGTDRVTVKDWFNNVSGATRYQVERVEFADGTVWTSADLTSRGLQVAGTAGADTLVGVNNYENIIDGADGADSVTGGNAADTLLGGAGNDTLNGLAGADVLEGGEGNDVLDGGQGYDTLRGGAGDDTLGGAKGGANYDSGVDTNGVSFVAGSLGNTLEGGTGNDTLRGTAMADLYLFNLGDGADTITEVEATYSQPAGQVDVLRFGAGIAPTDITVSRSAADLVLAHVNGADRVTFKSWFSNSGSSTNFQVERVEFADGTVWTAGEVTSRGLVVTGTESADTMTSLSNYSNTLNGLGGNDTLTGSNLADTLDGGDGNDTLDGAQGADVLRGGAGDDVLGGPAGGSSYDSGKYSNGSFVSGSVGNTYEGGTGIDTLRGTAMADLYLFNLGDGADTIIETYATSGQPVAQLDVLRFGPGIAQPDISFNRVGNDLVLAHTNGQDKVTVKDWFLASTTTANNQLERVEFADGTVAVLSTVLTVQGGACADTFAGSAGFSNVIDGGAGDDALSGADLSDTLSGGAGNDALSGLAGADVLEGGDGDDILDGGVGADTLRGGAGDDLLGGAQNADGYDSGLFTGVFVTGTLGNIYEGGSGNDTLRGTAMADLYHFNLGDGADVIIEVEAPGQPTGQADVLRFGAGIVAADIQITRNGLDLVLAHVNGTDRVTVKDWFISSSPAATQYRLEGVEFADGTSWTASYISATAQTIVGTEGPDTLVGVADYQNIINGAGGDDVITGANTSDTLNGNDGADVLYGLDGNDLLYGGTGDDIVEGGAGNDTLYGGTGANTLRGGAGNDVLRGDLASQAGDTYEGGTGSDTIYGTARGDLYLFGLGDGPDTLYETDVPNGQIDVLRFGPDIAPEDIAITRSQYHLLFTHTNSFNQVVVRNWYSNSPSQTTTRIERIEFADGTVWSVEEATSRGLTMKGTPSGDSLTGLRFNANVLLGEAGNDTLSGGYWADELFGGAGADTLRGLDGNDLLIGGTGHDVLHGYDGDDHYSYFLGDGLDTIVDSSGMDTVDLSTLAASDVHFWKQDANLYIQVGEGTDGILVNSQFGTGTTQVEVILVGTDSFTAGQVADMAQVWPV